MAQKKLRILLAEAEPSETADTLRTLFPDAVGGLDLTVVSTMATLVPTVKLIDPEIILLDLELSMRDPLDAVHLVHRSAPGIPLVVLADPSQKQHAAQSLSEGAMDYVLKGFMDARTLGRVLRTALVVATSLVVAATAAVPLVVGPLAVVALAAVTICCGVPGGGGVYSFAAVSSRTSKPCMRSWTAC